VKTAQDEINNQMYKLGEYIEGTDEGFQEVVWELVSASLKLARAVAECDSVPIIQHAYVTMLNELKTIEMIVNP